MSFFFNKDLCIVLHKAGLKTNIVNWKPEILIKFECLRQHLYEFSLSCCKLLLFLHIDMKISLAYIHIAGATLGISVHGFTILQESYCILNFRGSQTQVLEIHGFTSRASGNPRVHRNPRNPS